MSIKFQTEEAQILGSTVQNLIALATRRPGFVHPYVNDWADAYSKLYKHSRILGPHSWLFLQLRDETNQCYRAFSNGQPCTLHGVISRRSEMKTKQMGLYCEQCQVCTQRSIATHSLSKRHTLQCELQNKHTSNSIFTLLVIKSRYGGAT
jgi:hypothetical protein